MDDWLAKLEIQNGTETAQLYRRLMSFLFGKANRVLTISSKMADYLYREFYIPEEKLQVVHNYIQPVTVMPLGKTADKVVRYFGGMEPDMSLATIHRVASAIESINESGPSRLNLRFSRELITSSALVASSKRTNIPHYSRRTLLLHPTCHYWPVLI